MNLSQHPNSQATALEEKKSPELRIGQLGAVTVELRKEFGREGYFQSGQGS